MNGHNECPWCGRLNSTGICSECDVPPCERDDDCRVAIIVGVVICAGCVAVTFYMIWKTIMKLNGN